MRCMLNSVSNLKKLKIAFLIFALLISILGLFFLFPKNISRIWIFGIVLVFDIYHWKSLKLVFKRNSGSLFYFFRIFYWLPEVLIVSLLSLSLFVKGSDAQNTTSTFILGIGMMIMISKFIAFFMLIFESIVRFFDWIMMCFVDAKVNFKLKPPRRFFFIKASLIVMVGLTLIFLSGIINTFRYEVKNVDVYNENLPPAFDGLRVVQFSDVHLVSWLTSGQLKKPIDAINKLSPDVIVFTGDLVSYKAAEIDPYKEILSSLKARYGVYAILGNHDYGDYVNWESEEAKKNDFKKFVNSFPELGWTLLRDENRRIFSSDSTQSIVIAGVENWSSNKRFGNRGDIDKALEGTSKDDYILLLSHDPSHWDYLMMQGYPIDLTLSGHTHAMQLGLNCCGLKWSPVSLINHNWEGLHEQINGDKKSALYVNVGLGSVGFISRVGFLPEITQITLHSGRKD